MAPVLTPPGETRSFDCRPQGFTPPQKDTIKLLQWNIERGYQLAGIIEELRRIDADIISLQEVDVGCERSGGTDTGQAIAAALQLNYVFLSEFQEVHSPLRDARTQGGGVHGNAILTKYDIAEVAVVPHSAHPVNWNDPNHALAKKEPRRGQRAVLRAVVTTPQGPLVVYNAHLEVFCGLLARIAQLADIFADARTQADAGRRHQAILGDMNTMAHGIARLSPNYCCDHMRLRSIGLDEAAVWHRHVLSMADPRYSRPAAAREPASGSSGTSVAAAAAADAAAVGPGGRVVNSKLLAWGLSPQVAADATNPGFEDPFDPSTVTLDNPAYRWFGLSLMKGKLDWVLLRQLRVAGTAVGNHDYTLSDHKWLAADVALL